MSDFDRAIQLMNVVEQCAKHGSAFPNINSMAMMELNEIERQLADKVPERKEALRRRDAKEQAERERGARNEQPGPRLTAEPPQTQVRPVNEPILQRPDPERSIPNDGPTQQSAPAHEPSTNVPERPPFADQMARGETPVPASEPAPVEPVERRV